MTIESSAFQGINFHFEYFKRIRFQDEIQVAIINMNVNRYRMLYRGIDFLNNK